MNKWIKHFEETFFLKEGEGLKEAVHRLVPFENMDEDATKNLARLKKTILYIDQLLKSCDPELMPIDAFPNFSELVGQIHEDIKGFLENKAIEKLTEANTKIDSIIKTLPVFFFNPNVHLEVTVKAIKSYSDTIDKQTKIIISKVEKSVNETKNYEEKSSELCQKIDESQKKIESLERTFFEEIDGQPNLEGKANNLLEKMNESHSKIKAYHSELTSEDEDNPSIMCKIKKSQETALKNSEDIIEQKKSSEEAVSELKDFHKKVFGEKNDEGELEGGLKKELEKHEEELCLFEKKQTKIYKKLKDQIEALLPGATSAGLASAYKDIKDDSKKSVKNFSTIFYSSLAGLFSVAAISIGLLTYGVIDKVDLVYPIPLIPPILWLVQFSSKRRSEEKRLEQEYTHKEALAKSYVGFKKAIDDLGASDKDLRKQLLETVIKAIAFNASTTLDKKHGDKMPILELLEGLGLSEKEVFHFLKEKISKSSSIDSSKSTKKGIDEN